MGWRKRDIRLLAQGPPQLRVTLLLSGVLARACARGLKSVRAGLIGTAAFSLCFVLLAASPGRAQSPPSAPPPPASPPSASPPSAASAASAPPPVAAAPLPGFVPPYEITKIVRASGFDPLAPPRREGTTYVVRATDFRGILMRVVVDARSGALRAVNRIVPGPAPYGVVGMMTPPYGPGPYGPPPYGPYGPPGHGPPPYGPPPYGPADIGDPEMAPMEADLNMPPPSSAPSTIYPGVHSLAPESPPLPRPRPAGLVSREAQPAAKPADTPGAKPDGAPVAASAPPAAPPPAAAPAAPQKKLVPSSSIPD
jgi:hypothetical protein